MQLAGSAPRALLRAPRPERRYFIGRGHCARVLIPPAKAGPRRKRLESPADAVLIRRCGIAAEWADALERVPDEHLAWNGWVLEKSLA